MVGALVTLGAMIDKQSHPTDLDYILMVENQLSIREELAALAQVPMLTTKEFEEAAKELCVHTATLKYIKGRNRDDKNLLTKIKQLEKKAQLLRNTMIAIMLNKANNQTNLE